MADIGPACFNETTFRQNAKRIAALLAITDYVPAAGRPVLGWPWRETSHCVMKPLVIDLYCGLGGWSEAFIAQGYRAVGFDVEKHDYGTGGYPGELVLRDVRSITGAELVQQYGVPACIVASPPCQEFSYMAMPWSKAKEKERKIQADPAERTRLTDLFNQCFRIQREVSEAVPIVIENVRGAQKWVGKARWNFGSFYLWGDVPA